MLRLACHSRQAPCARNSRPANEPSDRAPAVPHEGRPLKSYFPPCKPRPSTTSARPWPVGCAMYHPGLLRQAGPPGSGVCGGQPARETQHRDATRSVSSHTHVSLCNPAGYAPHPRAPFRTVSSAAARPPAGLVSVARARVANPPAGEDRASGYVCRPTCHDTSVEPTHTHMMNTEVRLCPYNRSNAAGIDPSSSRQAPNCVGCGLRLAKNRREG